MDPLELQEIGKGISALIRPQTFPLAIKLAASEAELPEKCKRPHRDLKIQNFLCQNLKMARTYGWTVGVTPDDCSCVLARHALGWATGGEEQDFREFGANFMLGVYAKTKQSALEFIETIGGLTPGSVAAVVVSPLEWTKVNPDVVLLYVNPAQVMRLTQGFLYEGGGAILSSFTGRMGSCHDGIIKTYLTRSPQVVIPGNGDRVWGNTQDNELLFALPTRELPRLLEGLQATHDAGIRYPVPTYMNFEPGFQEKFEKNALERADGTIFRQGEKQC